jgi:hypothetical protein
MQANMKEIICFFLLFSYQYVIQVGQFCGMYGFYYNIDWPSKIFALLGSDLFELVVVIIRHLYGYKELLERAGAAISRYPKFSQGQTHRICSSDI